jgi:hypothetical protein
LRNLAANTPALPLEHLEATGDRMKAVRPEADVTNYRLLAADLKLPDPDDLHVLAAAIAGNASVIVTGRSFQHGAGGTFSSSFRPISRTATAALWSV